MKCANAIRINNLLVYRMKIFIKYLYSDHTKNVLIVLLTLDG